MRGKDLIKIMKKLLQIAMMVCIMLGVSSCGSKANKDPKTIDTLNIIFVPSKNPDEINNATEPLKTIVKNSLTEQGFNINEVNITVGDNYEAAGEALASGSVDVGFIPAGTFVKYESRGVEPLLSATRNGLNVGNDVMDPKVWNENKPTTETDAQVNSYNSLIIAGPSEKGQALATKVNNGEQLTFEELNNATWCTSSPTSSSGYLYPQMWLKDNYGKTFDDLSNKTRATSYGDSMNNLAAGTCDISVGYGDLRIDYQDSWASPNGGTIWDDTNVIGVSGPIMNDTISVSTKSPNMSDELKTALINTFINLPNTDEGQEVMDIYSHSGYAEVKIEDYNKEREVHEQQAQN